jgi:hypothetical protein
MSQPETRQFTLRGMFILVTALAAWLGMSLALGPLGIVVGAVLCGVATVYFCRRSWTELAVVFAIVVVLFIYLLPNPSDTRTPYYRGACRNNLVMIGIALHNYHDVHGSWPPLVTYSATGRPMHSWRAHLLPFIERQDLAAQYNWNEPWNGPLNSRIDTVKNRVFQCPLDPAAKTGGISYLAIAVPGAKPGDPFAVIEVHGSGVGFFEPKDISLTDLLATKPPAGAIVPRGVHSAKTTVQVVWTDGYVEEIAIADLPKRLAELQLP